MSQRNKRKENSSLGGEFCRVVSTCKNIFALRATSNVVLKSQCNVEKTFEFSPRLQILRDCQQRHNLLDVGDNGSKIMSIVVKVFMMMYYSLSAKLSECQFMRSEC